MSDDFLPDPPVVGPFEAAREAVVDDVDALVAIARDHVAAIEGDRGADLLVRREAVDTVDPARLASLIESPTGVVVVGTFDGVVFGYAAARIESLADGGLLGRVEDLVVDPAARGLGIGEAMMNLVVDRLRAAGCEGVDAVALPGDRNTKNFFESFGLKARLLVVHRRLD